MSYLKYLFSIEVITGTATPLALDGNGAPWCTYVEVGDKSYSHHHAILISELSAHPELLSGRSSESGQVFPSLWIVAIVLKAFRLPVKTMSSLYLSTPI